MSREDADDIVPAMGGLCHAKERVKGHSRADDGHEEDKEVWETYDSCEEEAEKDKERSEFLTKLAIEYEKDRCETLDGDSHVEDAEMQSIVRERYQAKADEIGISIDDQFMIDLKYNAHLHRKRRQFKLPSFPLTLEEIKRHRELGSMQETCPHAFFDKYDGSYICKLCRFCINDSEWKMALYADRLREESERERNTTIDEIPIDIGNQQDIDDYRGSQSANRGVKIGFFEAFVAHYELWDWNTWELIGLIIMPLTSHNRCRFIDLPELKEFTGHADIFISYAQAGKLGDVVAAIRDGNRDPEECVWFDAFAVRQWPSASPDLNFASTIKYCDSFMAICSSLKELSEVPVGFMKFDDVPTDARRKIFFMRVWCLAEAHQAISMSNLPFIIKTGNYKLEKQYESEEKNYRLTFVENIEMLFNMTTLVDVQRAEATVVTDKQRIMDDICKGVGIEKLNKQLERVITSTWTAYCDEDAKPKIIACAASGDKKALGIIMSDPSVILPVARLGYIALLRKLLESGACDPRIVDSHGRNAIFYAEWTERHECAELLKEYVYDEFMLACYKGDVHNVRRLLEQDESRIKKKSIDERTPLMLCCEGGHVECMRCLLEVMKGKRVYEEGPEGRTALHFAASNGYYDCIQAIMDYTKGIDEINITDTNGNTALSLAYENGHKECVTLIKEHKKHHKAAKKSKVRIIKIKR